LFIAQENRKTVRNNDKRTVLIFIIFGSLL
jgi:hypothetical protein